MRGCLHCFSSGFIKPITRRNRHSWNLSQYDFYINAVKGGQRSLWSLFEEWMTRSGAAVLLERDSSVCGGVWGGALAAVCIWEGEGKWERGLMSVYFYFPLNFTHCWVSLLTDCLWRCWRSTSTVEEVVHITLPHSSISPCKTSTYLISWYEAHFHPSVHLCNLPPTRERACSMLFPGCSWGHSHRTALTLQLCARRVVK